jgi:hypothetical protein
VDFFFAQDDLERMPPEQTRILTLQAEPYPDGERVRVDIHMTPFQKRPHIEMNLFDGDGTEVATASVIEPMGWKLELTMHLRGARVGPFKLEARLFYPDGPQAATVSTLFEAIPAK